MAKNQRHATPIRPSRGQQLRAGWQWLRDLSGNRFARATLLPLTLVGVAACSLVIGLSGDEQTSPGAQQQLLAAPSADQSSLPSGPSTSLSQKTTPPAQANSLTSTPLAAISSQEKDAGTVSGNSDPETASEQAANTWHSVGANENRISISLDAQAKLDEILASDSVEQDQPEAAFTVQIEDVKRGDTLSTIFARVGLGASTVHRLTTSSEDGKKLTRVFPGQQLEFSIDSDGNLASLKHLKGPLEETLFTASDNTFVAEQILRTPEVRTIQRQANVTSSLSEAAFDAGLSSSLTMNMANIFGGVMDFALDVRPNDRFTVMYEELYLDGEKIDDGKIIAAQYVNAGKVFNAFRYEHENGEVGYYNEDGESMRKVFLRAPLDFTRVSSGFNLRRLHPITKKVRPHRGIDYAAPTGTPIFSVGDGRVAASGYSKANGNYVFIRHGDAYQTKYLHLKKRSVKSGQRVKQGQIIGSVGCTGMCTGPHLHYEFLVNGVHRNPRTIVNKLPKAKRLAKNEIARFDKATRPMQSLLQYYGGQTVVALSE